MISIVSALPLEVFVLQLDIAHRPPGRSLQHPVKGRFDLAKYACRLQAACPTLEEGYIRLKGLEGDQLVNF